MLRFLSSIVFILMLVGPTGGILAQELTQSASKQYIIVNGEMVPYEPEAEKQSSITDSLRTKGVRAEFSKPALVAVNTTPVDSVPPAPVQLLPDTDLQAVVTDSLPALSNSYPAADEIDQAWLDEVMNSNLYDWMHEDVTGTMPLERQSVDTLTLKTRLAELNSRTPINVEYSPILHARINKYLGQNLVYQERLMALSRFYFPLFEEYLDKYDMPLEIKYLAVVESALQPQIKSRVGATGLWQFMYATGQIYNLEVNSYIDERMDPIRATDAACQYLMKLHDIFDDWDLALAAYNSGPGNVAKAIRRSDGKQNYWNLRPYLPRETADYVPAFLAQMYLHEYADEHNLKPQRPEVTMMETDTIQVRQMITFDQVSRYTGASPEMIRFLNPIYKLEIIPVMAGKTSHIRLPVEAAARYVSNEDAIYSLAAEELAQREQPLPELLTNEPNTVYRVKSGDYLGRIANKYGVTVKQLKRWNNLRSNKLKIGQRIRVRSKQAAKPKPVANTGKHVVSPGDSLWSIAQRYKGVSVQNLRDLNGLASDTLDIGQVLKLK